MLVPQPPFALAVPSFPFPALAANAARVPLGGEREAVMACYMAARLVRDAVGPEAIPPSLRETRASGSRTWLAALAVPVAVRSPVANLLDSSALDDVSSMRTALVAVTAVTAIYLDLAANLELEKLAEALAA